MSSSKGNKRELDGFKTEKNSRKSGVPVPTTVKPKTGRGRAGSNEKDPPRPLVKQGSKKHLQDENTRLVKEINSKTERIKEIEAMLKESEKKYQTLETEAEEKENSHHANLEKAHTKCEEAESKLSQLQNRVLMSNIDPVTRSEITNEDEENKFLKQTNAKEEVTRLRETLTCLNTFASEQLQYLKTAELDLGVIVDRGGSS